MAKTKKKQKKQVDVDHQNKKPFSVTEKHQDYLLIGVMIVILLILLKPIVIDGLSPQGVDVVASKGKGKIAAEFEKKTGEQSLWNPAIFAGMPSYHRKGAVSFSIDSILGLLGRIFNSVFIYYIFGGIGLYILLRYLKMSPLIAFFGAIVFILLPHYKSLYVEGHFTKFRAVMWLPWISLTFLYFLEKRNLLSIALFALAFGNQIRTQHYQIVFYTGFLIFAIGVYPFIKNLTEKNYKLFFKSTALLLFALGLAITMAAQPLFLAKEYLPYSKRGKTTINLKQKDIDGKEIAKTDGVKMEYAAQWSTHPSEIITWLIPRFYGGMSGEKYTGTNVPQAKNRVIPGYWGYMPFTQSYEYIGIIAIILAIIGIYHYRKNRFIMSLGIFVVFLILLSFGRHFESFYSIFYYNFPFFNKFRAPMMSITVTSFIICIFSAYGLKYLLNLQIKDTLKEHKTILLVFAGFIIFGIILLIASQGFSFAKAGENYEPQVQNIVHEIRNEFFNKDLLRYFILIILSGISILAYLSKKISLKITIAILSIISIYDLIDVQSRYENELINVDRLEKQYFRKNSTNIFLENDKQLFRIFPLGRLFNDNQMAYYHQTIGGYTPIKMYTIEEIIENCIYSGWDKKFPINWNVLKMLNVKYVVIQQEVSNDNLTLVHSNPENKLYTYRFKENLLRGFFVGDYKVVPDEYDRLELLNNPNFDVAKTAILEEEILTSIQNPDSSISRLTSFSPNKIAFEVYTDKTSLFVISEMYYPPGWKIFIDEQKVEKIYKTNHAVQSVVVQPGKHTVELFFEPGSYYNNVRLAYASSSILYLTILISLIVIYKEKIKYFFKKIKTKSK